MAKDEEEDEEALRQIAEKALGVSIPKGRFWEALALAIYASLSEERRQALRRALDEFKGGHYHVDVPGEEE
ncbi:MAG: hypothetical protein V3U52_05295 [Thermoplasmata archaeon]